MSLGLGFGIMVVFEEIMSLKIISGMELFLKKGSMVVIFYGDGELML